MEPLKVNDKNVKKAIQSDTPYIQVGNRKFLLIEIEEVNNINGYEVNDPVEAEKLLAALNDENPLLSEDEINEMLGD